MAWLPILTEVDGGDTGEVENAEEVDIEGNSWWELRRSFSPLQ